MTAALQRQLQTIVVIYAENRSFDSLFGSFPGAAGLNEVVDAGGKPLPAYVPQKDRDGSLLATLPQTWGGVTAAGATPVVTQAQSAGLPNAPFSIETAFTAASGVRLSSAVVTRDLIHRFYENQMQIDGGSNAGFAAWSNAGGLALGHFDYSGSALYRLAQQYVLADHFFQGAFGGSFLNHQYLICACASEYPHADTPSNGAHPSIALLERDADGHYLPRLTATDQSPASALTGAPRYLVSGNISPDNYFGDHKFYAINTMQPAYQPSGNPPIDAAHLQSADPGNDTTLPPQTQATIGDLLSSAGISWKWYSGAWNAALADGRQPADTARRVIYTPATPLGEPDFQPHHVPFNYYAAFDPATHSSERAAHLQDYSDLLRDIQRGHLPAVAFYKPQGNLNQHPGYANLDDGDRHIAQLVQRLRASPQWRHMLILITYDEFGGIWDHLPPPQGDLLGPGTRIPAILISPLAKPGTVDHTPYDTASILRLITRRYRLPTLDGIRARDAALQAHGAPAMGDLTAPLALLPPDRRGNRKAARR
ncbi:MAG: acid phosphatase [Nevskia sp.]|nr:acid phosphatase [Nevskia sp.]